MHEIAPSTSLVGDVVLTHFGSWDNIDRTIQETAVENLYVAPGE